MFKTRIAAVLPVVFGSAFAFGEAATSPLDELLPVPKIVAPANGLADAEALARVSVVTSRVVKAPATVSKESYRLEIAPSGVTITASDERGFRYARVTLDQLAKLSGGKGVPCCRIEDWPNLRWRGCMLDTARNYLDVDSLKRVIDMMGRYKLNLFHWHITENHAWRLESKRHPELQTENAYKFRHIGKYYSQDEFREIVAYAKARGITVMPELDFPGHSLAFRSAMGFETMKDPRVAQVVADLLDELCTLASPEDMPFVHVGGDEVGGSKYASVEPETLRLWSETLARNRRTRVQWLPGEDYPTTGPTVAMHWGTLPKVPPVDCPPIFDANNMYVEGYDPFQLVRLAAFRDCCGWTELADEKKWGAIFCAWHDGAAGLPYTNLLRNQQIMPCCVLFGNNYWSGCLAPHPDYETRMPAVDDPEFPAFVAFENRVRAQRDKVLTGLRDPFHFLCQSGMRWRMTDTKTGELLVKDIPGTTIRPYYLKDSKLNYITNNSGCVTLETWIKNPKAQKVGAWITFANIDRDHGLYVWAPTAKRGEWTRFKPTAELNGELIPPPEWARPGLTTDHKPMPGLPGWDHMALDEEPFTDQEYFMRKPTEITLKEGWNHVRLTVPSPGRCVAWYNPAWIATFAPMCGETDHPQEVPGLEYSSDPK